VANEAIEMLRRVRLRRPLAITRWLDWDAKRATQADLAALASYRSRLAPRIYRTAAAAPEIT